MEGNIFYFPWEPELMAFIQSVATELQTVVMTAVTVLGEEMVMIAIMAYLYLCFDKKMGSRMSAGLIFTLLAGTFLKNVCLRRRPYFDNPGVQCLRAPSGRGDIMDIAVQGYSFPSLGLYPMVFRHTGRFFAKKIAVGAQMLRQGRHRGSQQVICAANDADGENGRRSAATLPPERWTSAQSMRCFRNRNERK